MMKNFLENLHHASLPVPLPTAAYALSVPSVTGVRPKLGKAMLLGEENRTWSLCDLPD